MRMKQSVLQEYLFFQMFLMIMSHDLLNFCFVCICFIILKNEIVLIMYQNMIFAH
jgi:hypothetical protein